MKAEFILHRPPDTCSPGEHASSEVDGLLGQLPLASPSKSESVLRQSSAFRRLRPSWFECTPTSKVSLEQALQNVSSFPKKFPKKPTPSSPPAGPCTPEKAFLPLLLPPPINKQGQSHPPLGMVTGLSQTSSSFSLFFLTATGPPPPKRALPLISGPGFLKVSSEDPPRNVSKDSGDVPKGHLALGRSGRFDFPYKIPTIVGPRPKRQRLLFSSSPARLIKVLKTLQDTGTFASGVITHFLPPCRGSVSPFKILGLVRRMFLSLKRGAFLRAEGSAW